MVAAAVVVIAALVMGYPRAPATSIAPLTPDGTHLATATDVAPSPSSPLNTPAAAPSVTPTPVTARILTPAELSEFASDPRLTGQVALARVTIDATVPNRFSPYEHCAPGVVCPAGMITDTEPAMLLLAGWRRSSRADGIVVDEPSGESYWGALLDIPAGRGVFAFESTGHGDEVIYLGHVVVGASNDVVWTVDQLPAATRDEASSEVYAVAGWMVQTPSISCPAPADLFEPGGNTRYWCGGTFITQEPRRLRGDGYADLSPQGLHVESGTYSELYPDGDYDPVTGYEPRLGTYLVRPAGCPPAVWDERCPVWDFVGWVDRPHGAPEPPPHPTPGPDGSVRLWNPTELLALTNDPGALGMVVLSDAPVVITPGAEHDPRCLPPSCNVAAFDATGVDAPVFVRSPAGLEGGSAGAYHVLDGAMERIGDVSLDGTAPWTVGALRQGNSVPGPLYAVDAWLTQPPDINECPDAPDPSEEADFTYWCNASWLTAERVDLPIPGRKERETIPRDALQVQNRAYTIFAYNAEGDVDGVEPWRDVYLVRRLAECPTNVLSECPVWELVANLDTRGPHTRTGCSSATVTVDRAPMTAQQKAAASDVIVVAMIHEIGPSFWDSPDGREPIMFHHGASILTLVESNIESVLKGDGTAAQRAVQPGGRVGCDSEQHYDVLPQMTEGMRYVLFMNPGSYRNPDADGDPFIWEAWPVTADGRLFGADEPVQLEDLADYLAL